MDTHPSRGGRESIADRELETWVCIDQSASLDFGTAQMEKRDLALQAVAAIGFLTARVGNRFGAVLVEPDHIVEVPARQGRAHLMSILNRMQTAPRRDSSDDAQLAKGIRRLMSPAHRRGLAVVVSDLLAPEGWAQELARVAVRHDVLVIEDEPDLRGLLDRQLDRAGYKVLMAEDGLAGLETAWRESVDLVLLDVMLPHLDGLEVCRRLKRDPRTSRLPVIMLTAKGEPVDRIVGLELGADDYITKPFNLRELLLRIAAVLRRGQGDELRPDRIEFDGLKVDAAGRTVEVQGESIHLTTREFDLLHFLLTHPSRVFSRAELLRQVWDYDFEGYDRTVDAHVARLRRKLGEPGDWIETAWGVGYKFNPPSG